MPVYEFKCILCGVHVDYADRQVKQRCESCDGTLKRVFSCSIRTAGGSFQPHFNNTVGAYVSSWSEFCSKLERRSEDNTRLTGIDHSYTPIAASDMRDLPGTTSEGLDTPRYDPNLTNRKTFS